MKYTAKFSRTFEGVIEASSLEEAAKATCGERNPMAQLCERDVLEIRAQAAAGVPRRDIAARLGTRTHNVTRIVERQRWAHI